MTKSLFSLIVLALTVVVDAQGATYTLTSHLSGQDFLDAFGWQAIPDPTNGDVNYVSQATAKEDGLYSITGSGAVILRADDTTVLSGSGPGRNSFHLRSVNTYMTHVAIFDIAHIPQGCGTWPAVWFVFLLSEVGAVWPDDGEIDILEGVNDQVPNTSTLHTGTNCNMPATRTMSGKSLGTNCDVWETGNSGCSVSFEDNNSFGPNFNNLGGGWYAIERSDTYISIYFWERGNPEVPSQVSSPGSTVDTSTWGEPAAYFPSTDCDFSTNFGPQNIIIDLTFCGDLAGALYGASGCPSTCTDYVNSNPSAFTNAYFEFNALTIFE